MDSPRRRLRACVVGVGLVQPVIWLVVPWLVRPWVGGCLVAMLAEAAIVVALLRVAEGYGGTPVIVSSSEPSPVVDAPPELADRVRDLEHELEAHRREALGRLDAVRSSCDTLRRTGADLSRAALRVASETTTVAVTAEDADRRVAGLAAAGREFAEAIASIGTSAMESARKGAETRERIEAAAAIMVELQNASQTIGSMTALISGIASQTNLLALNATIEAARAGEQGRGFAVVAGEVKALAAGTARAVATITDMVDRIRAATGRTVETIDAIGASVGALNVASAGISASVETRIEAAERMAHSIDETAANIAFVASSIGRIEASVDEASQGAGFLLATADEIASQEAAMRAEIVGVSPGAPSPRGSRASLAIAA